jgi:hypothetical protein
LPPPALGIRAGPTGGAGAAPAVDDRQAGAPPRLLAAESAARCARRHERERPGELLHIDGKKLGRFWEPGKRVLGAQAGRPHGSRRIGWQHLHVAIDVDRPGFGGQRLVRRLVALSLSFSRSRQATGSRAWSGA